MNNQIPFFIPNNNINNLNFPMELDRLNEKINRLEKNIRILENQLNKIDCNKKNSEYIEYNSKERYMI